MRDSASHLLRRLRSEWRMKLWLGAALALVVCVGYFGIQRIPRASHMTLEPNVIDTWIGFSGSWTGVYLSLYLLLPVAWLATTREQLRRYAAGMLLIAACGFVTFLIWPVAGPRPTDVSPLGPYALLVRYDLPLNSVPSLHIAFAVYSVCFCARVMSPHGRGLVAALWLWTLLIAYAALATKQHYAIDLPPGALLGWLAHAAVWRARTPRAVIVERGRFTAGGSAA